MAAPVAVKSSPFSSAGVCVRLLLARLRGLSPRCHGPVPKPRVDDGLMLTGIGCALVHGLAAIDAVVSRR